MTNTEKKCACCPVGCTCGDCSGCTPSSSCATPFCGLPLGKKLLCFLLAGILFACGVLVGARHGGYGERDGRGGCALMNMMHHGEKSRGCGMQKGGSCGKADYACGASCTCGDTCNCGGSCKCDTGCSAPKGTDNGTGGIATGN